MSAPAPIRLVEQFLDSSWDSVESLARALAGPGPTRRGTTDLFRFHGGRRESVPVPAGSFLLRTSVEYANPQLTLEELQGILLARLLEVCGSAARGATPARPTASDLPAIAARLAEPPRGEVVPFVLNVDDIEPDRYSVNPLRASVGATHQSARAVADVEIDGLELDPAFLDRYRGKLIAESDARVIEEELRADPRSSYVDLVDRVKYRQLEGIGSALGIDLGIPALRMPLATLRAETPSGTVHQLVSAAHRDVATLRRLYALFGREFGRRKTLLPAVPHGPGKVASKRLVRGKVVVTEERIERVDVRYGSGPLYPNEIDKDDIATASADVEFTVDPARLREYDYRVTPASPQFAIYMLASPEDGAIWHGVGKYAGIQIVESYTAFHRACHAGEPFFGVPVRCRPDPPQWDLVADSMLVHPTWGNIDASVGCVDDLPERLARHLRIRPLPLPEHRVPVVEASAE